MTFQTFMYIAIVVAISILYFYIYKKIISLKRSQSGQRSKRNQRSKNENISIFKLYKRHRLLKKMNKSYTKIFDYINIKSNVFMKEPSIRPDQNLIDEKMAYYRDNNIRLKDVALSNIRDLIKSKSVLIETKKYYQNHILFAKDTILILRRDSRHYGYEQEFKDLFQQRIHYLKNICEQCGLIDIELSSKISECDAAIYYNEQLVKTNFLEKIVEVTFSIVTAPIRHGANFIDGISSGDSKKAWKSGALLGLTVIGVGAIGDALDVLDGLESFDTVADPEFVSPFERTLEDGSTIWVDGDGNTEIDLTVEEGGGFYRN